MSNTQWPRVGVAVVIRDSAGRVLLGLRKQRPAGVWQTPGGALETGEPPEDAVRREAREETGLELGAVYRHPVVPYTSTYVNGSQWITLFFVAEYIGGTPRAMEPEKCDRWEWFPTDALPSPMFESLESGVFDDCSVLTPAQARRLLSNVAR